MRAVINLTSKIESIEELHPRQMMEYEDLDKKNDFEKCLYEHTLLSFYFISFK